jgi:hypothetical protein
MLQAPLPTKPTEIAKLSGFIDPPAHAVAISGMRMPNAGLELELDYMSA